MEGMRYLIVANPTAGRGRGAKAADAIHHRLREAGADSRVAFTAARGDATSIVREAMAGTARDESDRLCAVACGGDGTVHEVVNALLAAGPDRRGVLGLAPAGRCNDFASALGIRADPDAVARVLLAACARPVDLGRINDQYFCSVATFGFDSAVCRYVNDMRMPLRGTPAYTYGTLRVLWRFAPCPVRLTLDDETIEGPVYLAATANTRSYGGRMLIAPEARADDGLLDLCIVDVIGRLRFLRLFRRVMRGRHVDLPEVRLPRTRRLRIETQTPHEIWADGEYVTDTPVTIDSIPNAIEILLPPDPPSVTPPTETRP